MMLEKCMKKNLKKVTKTATALGLGMCACINSPLASAAMPENWYGGASLGQSIANVDDGRIRSELLGSGIAITSIGDNERDLGYKLFGGYQFNKNVALEAGYFHLGEFGFDANTSPTGTLHGKIKARGVNVDVVGLLPLDSIPNL